VKNSYARVNKRRLYCGGKLSGGQFRGRLQTWANNS